MSVVTIRELNANISKVLSRVAAGETLEIMRNGEVIAELRPKNPVRDEKWWRAYRESVDLLSEGLPGKIGKITEDDKYGNADL
jgi:antitoxin (DNA-binding transcriptional repressor) of toxin-antitoxin stability system